MILILFAITLLVDFIWLVYWGPFWRSDIMKDWERGIHNFVIFMGVVGFIYKIFVIVWMILAEGRAMVDNSADERLNRGLAS